MGNGYLKFQLATGKYYKFQTSRPWEEARAFQHTHDITKEGCYTCELVEHKPTMPSIAEIDTGKSGLSALREAYHHALQRQKLTVWCPWYWHFDETTAWLSPKDAETLSQMWKPVWADAFKEANNDYPINDIYTRHFLKQAEEVLTYAAINGLWVNVVHNNGY